MTITFMANDHLCDLFAITVKSRAPKRGLYRCLDSLQED